MDLIAKYKSQLFLGSTLNRIKEQAKNIKSTSGFIINNSYYPCVCELFVPMNADKRFKYTNKRCYTVAKTLGILGNTSMSEFSCGDCLLKCIDKITSDNAQIKIKL